MVRNFHSWESTTNEEQLIVMSYSFCSFEYERDRRMRKEEANAARKQT